MGSPQQLRDVNEGSYAYDDDEDDEEEEYHQAAGHGAQHSHPYAQGAQQYDDDEAYSDEEPDTPPKRKKWLGLV